MAFLPDLCPPGDTGPHLVTRACRVWRGEDTPSQWSGSDQTHLPRKTFQSSGSSSRLVARSKRPKPVGARVRPFSRSGSRTSVIVRTDQRECRLASRRRWVKSTGLPSCRRTMSASAARSGIQIGADTATSEDPQIASLRTDPVSGSLIGTSWLSSRCFIETSCQDRHDEENPIALALRNRCPHRQPDRSLSSVGRLRSIFLFSGN